jgi:hypothetical protein
MIKLIKVCGYIFSAMLFMEVPSYILTGQNILSYGAWVILLIAEVLVMVTFLIKETVERW